MVRWKWWWGWGEGGVVGEGGWGKEQEAARGDWVGRRRCRGWVVVVAGEAPDQRHAAAAAVAAVAVAAAHLRHGDVNAGRHSKQDGA